MKKTWKQTCSLLLSICMLMSMLPVTAFAGTGESDETVINSAVITHAPMAAATSQTAITINSQEDWDDLSANPSNIATSAAITLNVGVRGNLEFEDSIERTLTIIGNGNTLAGSIMVYVPLNLTLQDMTVIADTTCNSLTFWKGGKLTTLGTVNITGKDDYIFPGCGLLSDDSLTITASDETTFKGGSSGSGGGGIGIRLQHGSLTLDGGNPAFIGGSSLDGFGALIDNGDLIITAGSPTFTGGAAPSYYSYPGAAVRGKLSISTNGSPIFTAGDGIGQNMGRADGANVGSFDISSGSPVFKGGSASDTESISFAGPGISSRGASSISGTASPTFIGGDAAHDLCGGEGAYLSADLTISTSETVEFKSGNKGLHGIVIDYIDTVTRLDLSNLTGKLIATGDQSRAIETNGTTVVYPDGLNDSSKYNGTFTSYTLNMMTDDIDVYGIIVGGVEVTSANKDNITGKGIRGIVTYEPDTETLILNNAVIAENTKMDNTTAINASGDLTVELIGSSSLGSDPDNPNNGKYPNIDKGIKAVGKINITGGGNLTIYNNSQGIIAKDITVDIGGTLTVEEYGAQAEGCCLKAEGGTLTIEKGTLKLTSQVSNALYGDRIIINGGTVTAIGLDTDGVSNFAFNTAPEFASIYKHKVFAGGDESSAEEIKMPVADTFIKSKYVHIELDVSDIPDIPDIPKPGKDDDNNGDDNGNDNDNDNNKNSSSTAANPAEPTKIGNTPVEDIFGDVVNHWAIDSIQFVYDRGIMTGSSGKNFSPDAQMSRGMLITALGRLGGINILDFTSVSFNDVSASSYYAPYAEWSLISNITRGTGSKNFSPDNNVTREELAVILVNFAKAMGYELPSGEGAESFVDDGAISPWAKEEIEIMRNANIMNGDTNNNFNPKAPATRAEIAAVLRCFIELMGI